MCIRDRDNTSSTKAPDEFIINTTDPNDSIAYYDIKFIKFIDNIRTADGISVIVNPTGDIIAVDYKETGIESYWDKDFSIDEKKLNDTLEMQIKDHLNSSYQYKQHELRESLLRLYDQKLYLFCMVNILIEDTNGEEINSIIQIAVDITS